MFIISTLKSIFASHRKLQYTARELEIRRMKVLTQRHRKELSGMLKAQIICAGLLFTFIWWCCGIVLAKSFLSGSLVSIIPTQVFALMVFRHQGARQARFIVKDMYVGEGIKMLLTAMLFAALVVYVHPIWWACFLSYLLTQMSLCVAPLFRVSNDSN